MINTNTKYLCFLVGTVFATNAQADELYINSASEHYVLGLPRETGERNILNLSKTADKEESWTFVKYKDGREIWYEDGGESNVHYVKPDPAILDKILADSESVAEISHYHLHPPLRDGFVNPYFPSMDDSYYAIQSGEKIYKEASDIVFDDRIVTPCGIYVQSFDPAGFKKQERIVEMRKVVSEEFINAVATGEFPYNFDSDDISVLQTEAQRYAAAISGRNVTVTFIAE